MDRDELIAQRAELERQEANHLTLANQARGGIRLIDIWLTRPEFSVQPETDESTT